MTRKDKLFEGYFDKHTKVNQNISNTGNATEMEISFDGKLDDFSHIGFNTKKIQSRLDYILKNNHIFAMVDTSSSERELEWMEQNKLFNVPLFSTEYNTQPSKPFLKKKNNFIYTLFENETDWMNGKFVFRVKYKIYPNTNIPYDVFCKEFTKLWKSLDTLTWTHRMCVSVLVKCSDEYWFDHICSRSYLQGKYAREFYEKFIGGDVSETDIYDPRKDIKESLPRIINTLGENIHNINFRYKDIHNLSGTIKDMQNKNVDTTLEVIDILMKPVEGMEETFVCDDDYDKAFSMSGQEKKKFLLKHSEYKLEHIEEFVYNVIMMIGLQYFEKYNVMFRFIKPNGTIPYIDHRGDYEPSNKDMRLSIGGITLSSKMDLKSARGTKSSRIKYMLVEGYGKHIYIAFPDNKGNIMNADRTALAFMSDGFGAHPNLVQEFLPSKDCIPENNFDIK